MKYKGFLVGVIVGAILWTVNLYLDGYLPKEYFTGGYSIRSLIITGLLLWLMFTSIYFISKIIYKIEKKGELAR